MKKNIKVLIALVVNGLCRIKLFRKMFEIVYDTIRNSSKTVVHNGLKIELNTPNLLNDFRVETYASKEPEMLQWIEDLPENSIIWDIGANVGLYSIYAAKIRNARVYAFEPSVFNLELLARNIFLNQLMEKITIIPLPLNNKLGISNMQLSTIEQGGALSTFEHNVGFDGKKIDKLFEFGVVGISMDLVIDNLGIQQPDYIKMDVDGIEHLILSGGEAVLSKIKGIIIEINEDFTDQFQQSSNLLMKAGLKLLNKRHGEVFNEENSWFKNCYNQIWVREK